MQLDLQYSTYFNKLAWNLCDSDDNNPPRNVNIVGLWWLATIHKRMISRTFARKDEAFFKEKMTQLRVKHHSPNWPHSTRSTYVDKQSNVT